ncbi:MAG: hypothetical protein LWX07_04180 [Bacteroidetes bacterium]|nr:hypothetical protein [Bacteroidota bacterium]
MKTPIQHKNKRKKSSFIKENGEPCNSFASNDSDFCYMHDPSISEKEKSNARSKGGKVKTLVINPSEVVSEIKLNDAKQVTKFYSKIINDVMSNKLDLRMATGIGYLLNGLLKSMELSSIEERVTELEKRLTGNNNFNLV